MKLSFGALLADWDETDGDVEAENRKAIVGAWVIG